MAMMLWLVNVLSFADALLSFLISLPSRLWRPATHKDSGGRGVAPRCQRHCVYHENDVIRIDDINDLNQAISLPSPNHQQLFMANATGIPAGGVSHDPLNFIDQTSVRCGMFNVPTVPSKHLPRAPASLNYI